MFRLWAWKPHRLGVTFELDGDVCRGEFSPRPEHMGYDQVTHGGIVFSLLDDVMANWVCCGANAVLPREPRSAIAQSWL